MSKITLPAYEFPLASFIRIKNEITFELRALRKERADWAERRQSLSEEMQAKLDNAFMTSFEAMYLELPNKLEPTLLTLRDLVQKGASARLLDNYELGGYNVPGLIRDIAELKSQESLDMAAEIVRLSIVADADLCSQKGYVGNGGCIALEWAYALLQGALGGLNTQEQYACCFRILPWLAEDMHTDYKGLSHYSVFLADLRKDKPDTRIWLEKVCLVMMILGHVPFSPRYEDYQYKPLFTSIITANENLLALIFPYENAYVSEYLERLKPYINTRVVQDMVTGITASNKGRKYFRAYFSSKPHWLLKYMIDAAPHIIFNLVKRNERELLIPFVKTFRSAVVNMRDEKGNTLLHQAVICKPASQATIQLLMEAGLSLSTVNKEGLSPLELALKYKKSDVVSWLKP